MVTAGEVMTVIRTFIRFTLTGIFTVILSLFVLLPSFAFSEETYQFKRLWPRLKQPWYFYGAVGIDVDKNNYVYVADDGNNRILKYTSDGRLVRSWGSYCKIADNTSGCGWGMPGGQAVGDGQFYSPHGIAVDAFGYIYVLDKNNRVQKFNSDGEFILKWDNADHGGFALPAPDPDPHCAGQTDCSIYMPRGIAVDSNGYVYVVDTGNNRIVKFTSEGQYVYEKGSLGSGTNPPQFNSPTHIEVDANDDVYVADTGNNRIMKITSDGSFVLLFDATGNPFDMPLGIGIDSQGYVYVSDRNNKRIQKYYGSGQHVANIDFTHSGDAFGPGSLAVDKYDRLLIADYYASYIDVYTSGGGFITKWTALCQLSMGACIDPDGAGPLEKGDGEFYEPSGIAYYSEVSTGRSYIYVVDRTNNRIQRFSSGGKFDVKWGTWGQNSGELTNPYGIAIKPGTTLDTTELFITETENNRVQVFDGNGTPQFSWTSGFNGPRGIAYYKDTSTGNSYLYVVDSGNNKVQLFSDSGTKVGEWGSYCEISSGTGCVDPDGGGPLVQGDGQFNSPHGIAVDNSGNVYVVDSKNHRMQKFGPSGNFLLKWGSICSDGGPPCSSAAGQGKFNLPYAVALDSSGDVYVADLRIQKFSPDGQYQSRLTKFQGSGPGQYKLSNGMAFDENNNLYVSDLQNARIQFLKRIYSTPDSKAIIVAGGGPYKGNRIWDVTESAVNLAYRALTHQGFTAERIFYVSSNTNVDADGDGEYDVDMTAWNGSLEYAITNWAKGADNLFVYLADHGGTGSFLMNEGETLQASDLNSWISTLQTDAGCSTPALLDESFESGLPSGWSIQDNENSGAVWRFDDPKPRGNVTGGSGHFAIVDSDYEGHVNMDTELRTPIINASGMSAVILEFKTDFDYYEGGNDEIADVDVSINGPSGPWTNVWRKTGADYLGPKTEIIDITSIAAGKSNVMVRFHYYNANYEWWWQIDDVYISGTETVEFLNGPFEGPMTGWGVVDNAGSGAKWRFDDPELRGNQTGGSSNFAIADSDYEGIVDMDTELLTPPMDLSAMDTVTLEFKTGFYHNTDEIADVDVSVNGSAGPWTNIWQKTGADYTGPKTEVIDISSVAAGMMNVMIRFHYYNANYEWWWQVDDVIVRGAQKRCNRSVTVIYDACEAGSILSDITPPPSGKKRAVITSTSEAEKAKFAGQGAISFSNFFWSNIFLGLNVNDAFDNAKTAVQESLIAQTPQIQDTGSVAGMYIGNGTDYRGDMPEIVSASAPSVNGSTGIHSATITVNARDTNEVESVRAIIVPPGYSAGAENNAILEMPSIALTLTGGTAFVGTWTGTYDGFHIAGQYQIVIYAVDRDGDTSDPYDQLTVDVTNPVRRKAIIVAGGQQTDANRAAVEKGTLEAYRALKFQGYSNGIDHPTDDIKLLSNTAFSSAVDGPATITALNDAISIWAAGNTYDLVLYMIGEGDGEGFFINETETVSAANLDAWLDSLQATLPGKVTVIYDADFAGVFNSHLVPPAGKGRILIGSSGGNASFLSGGDISFSKYFWIKILNGWNVRDAHLHANDAMEVSTNYMQVAMIDDNGEIYRTANGTANEKNDGEVAKDYVIGTGIKLGGNDPLVGVVSGIELSGDTHATINVDNVITTGTLAEVDPVWAVITHPMGPLDITPVQTILLMTPAGGNSYSGTTGDIFTAFGRYEVTVYAKDNEGNISAVSHSTIYQKGLIDKYEPDNSYVEANIVVVNNDAPQQHNFHISGDEDWVKFYGTAGELYKISASNLGDNCTVVIHLYDESNAEQYYLSGGGEPIANWNRGGPCEFNSIPGEEPCEYTPSAAGMYYLRISNSGSYGNDTGYDLEVYTGSGDTNLPGKIRGYIYKSLADPVAVGCAVIKINGVTKTSSAINGFYYIPSQTPGSLSISAEKSGYTATYSFDLVSGGTEVINLYMPSGFSLPAEVCDLLDNDCDGLVDDNDPGVTGQPAWHPDADADTYGNPAVSQQKCVQPENYVADNMDCDDSDRYIYPDGPEVRIADVPMSYYWIEELQTAYDDAGTGETIQGKAATYAGSIAINQNKTVTIEGGYTGTNDCGFDSVTGKTIISGNMTVSSGTAYIENVRISGNVTITGGSVQVLSGTLEVQ